MDEIASDVHTCPECGETFVTREELDRHDHTMPLAWERGSSNFDCPFCGARFDEADELLTHQVSVHPGERAPEGGVR